MTDIPKPDGAAALRVVHSADETAIARAVTGHGEPLLLIHGTATDQKRWAPVLTALTVRWEVHAMDRRGRGASGDFPSYTLAREFEDVVAVIDGIGAPVAVIAHSCGAICALEAALLTGRIARLALYEPPMATGAAAADLDRDRAIQTLIEAGDDVGALVAFYRDATRMPLRELAALQASPGWTDLVSLVRSIPREMRAAGAYPFVADRFAALNTPALLLLGGDSPALFSGAIALLARTLPDARTVTLPGQQHQAINLAPAMFLEPVLAFLQSRD